MSHDRAPRSNVASPGKSLTSAPPPRAAAQAAALLLLLSAVAIGPARGADLPAFSEKTAALIDSTVRAHMDAGKVAGLALQVTQHGKTVLSKGYGKANLEWGAPATADTVFRIASTTKSITAASILMLAEKGALSLDDKLSKYLPDFPRAAEVTIRQLLLHTSGIIDYPDAYAHKEEWVIEKSMPQMIDVIAHLSPLYAFTPGSKFGYSNSGYYILGFIVEKVSGMSLDAFMRENLFRKLGMDHTDMDHAEPIVANRAAGYDPVADQPGKFQNALYTPYTYPGPAGGLRSTVGDLSKWYQALLGGKVIGPSLLKEMTSGDEAQHAATNTREERNAAVIVDHGYGYGLRAGEQAGHRFLMHTGHIHGFNAYAKTFPDDQVTIVMLCNTSKGLDEIQDKIVATVLGMTIKASP